MTSDRLLYQGHRSCSGQVCHGRCTFSMIVIIFIVIATPAEVWLTELRPFVACTCIIGTTMSAVRATAATTLASPSPFNLIFQDHTSLVASCFRRERFDHQTRFFALHDCFTVVRLLIKNGASGYVTMNINEILKILQRPLHYISASYTSVYICERVSLSLYIGVH